MTNYLHLRNWSSVKVLKLPFPSNHANGILYKGKYTQGKPEPLLTTMGRIASVIDTDIMVSGKDELLKN